VDVAYHDCIVVQLLLAAGEQFDVGKMFKDALGAEFVAGLRLHCLGCLSGKHVSVFTPVAVACLPA